MGASSAAFPPFIVVEMALLSLSHLIHALENNSALELENINGHVIVSSKYRLVCVCFCNQVRHVVTKATSLVLLLREYCAHAVKWYTCIVPCSYM